MDNGIVLLRLEGVLQSWGEYQKWDKRDTAALPTKSGVVGMLGCALGLERGNAELVTLSKAISIAVRVDRPGQWMTDYHTVQSENLLTANGGHRNRDKSGFATIVSERGYLQDASFLVVLQTTQVWAERIEYALRHPVWPMCLGRKSCVPSRPVWEISDVAYTDWLDALQRHSVVERAQFPLRYECEVPNENSTYWRTDMLTSAKRDFARRQVWNGWIEEVK